MPTPNLYAHGGGYPGSSVSRIARSNSVNLLYVTDRAPETVGGKLAYGARRFASAGSGYAIVEMGDDLSWADLVAFSSTARRAKQPDLKVSAITELSRFPATPRPFTVIDDVIVEDPEVEAAKIRADDRFLEHLGQRMATAIGKEVFVFVHGYNNSFDEAACALAEVWHFLGRRGVPILYSWPAAHGGPFGYFADRESGEFTVYHLKEFLRLVSSSPEVEQVHILAHSRGTDVATTALRELVIQERAAGNNPRESLRIANLVLAAPDLDYDVVRQRLMAERFGPAIGQITIYTAQADKALRVSQTLMSGVRFGRLQEADLGEREEQIFANLGNVNIIEVQGGNGLIGHAYFHSNPAVSSDLILLLRDGGRPGDPSRPLERVNLNFWKMPRDYPKPPLPTE